jgi:hypothetical protein
VNGFNRLWGRRSDSPLSRISRHPIGSEDQEDQDEEEDQLMSSILSIEAGSTPAATDAYKIIDWPRDVRQRHASSIPRAHPAAMRLSPDIRRPRDLIDDGVHGESIQLGDGAR